MVQYLLKSLYFDLTCLVALPLATWGRLTASKYKCIIFLLLGKNGTVLNIGACAVEVKTISDVGTFVSSLSDEYFHLRTVIKGQLRTVLDVGANVGQFATAVSYWYRAAELHCIEADPSSFQTLKRNVRGRTVNTYNFAASDTSGEAFFYRSSLSVSSSLVKPNSFTQTSASKINVKTETLDKVFAGLETIDLLKIDVEGAEMQVLLGAKEVLQRSRYLLIEVSFEREISHQKNLAVLALISRICNEAEIIHVGRKLGWRGKVVAQDFLIALNNVVTH